MTTLLGLLLLALVYGAARIMEHDASLDRLGRLGEHRFRAPDALPSASPSARAGRPRRPSASARIGRL